jgi:hypothetical protein
MTAVKVFSRGATVVFNATFTDNNGVAAQPASGAVSLAFQSASAGEVTGTIPLLPPDTGNVWTGVWETLDAAPGAVSWSATGVFADLTKAVVDGQFTMGANAANTSQGLVAKVLLFAIDANLDRVSLGTEPEVFAGEPVIFEIVFYYSGSSSGAKTLVVTSPTLEVQYARLDPFTGNVSSKTESVDIALDPVTGNFYTGTWQSLTADPGTNALWTLGTAASPNIQQGFITISPEIIQTFGLVWAVTSAQTGLLIGAPPLGFDGYENVATTSYAVVDPDLIIIAQASDQSFTSAPQSGGTAFFSNTRTALAFSFNSNQSTTYPRVILTATTGLTGGHEFSTGGYFAQFTYTWTQPLGSAPDISAAADPGYGDAVTSFNLTGVPGAGFPCPQPASMFGNAITGGTFVIAGGADANGQGPLVGSLNGGAILSGAQTAYLVIMGPGLVTWMTAPP